jgi:hypothetical protein
MPVVTPKFRMKKLIQVSSSPQQVAPRKVSQSGALRAFGLVRRDLLGRRPAVSHAAVAAMTVGPRIRSGRWLAAEKAKR